MLYLFVFCPSLAPLKRSSVPLVDRVDGVMRTMTVEKLIKTLPIIQNQLDALLDFQVGCRGPWSWRWWSLNEHGQRDDRELSA